MSKIFDLKHKTILLTGGTGSFGHKCTEILLKKYQPKSLRIFSRDELKQYEMQQLFKDYDNLRFFVGDVRDKERVYRAMHGVDVVIHAAALKHVPILEYNPLEAVKTNVLGAENIINAAIDQGVSRIMALSTDKAVNPVNLYGATKLCAEKLFIAANSYAGSDETRFAVVRYGNVVGSRGSVVPFFLKKRETGVLPITDTRMTRFWITLEQGVSLVIEGIERMHGGEIFIPKIPSMKVTDLAAAVSPDSKIDVIGIRPGEKLHEVLVTEEESRHTLEFDDTYVVQPDHPYWEKNGKTQVGGRPVKPGFRYDSENNTQWLSIGELRSLIGLEEPSLQATK